MFAYLGYKNAWKKNENTKASFVAVYRRKGHGAENNTGQSHQPRKTNIKQIQRQNIEIQNKRITNTREDVVAVCRQRGREAENNRSQSRHLRLLNPGLLKSEKK